MDVAQRVVFGLIISSAAIATEAAEYTMPARDPPFADSYVYVGHGNRDAGRAETDAYMAEIGFQIGTSTILAVSTSYLESFDENVRIDSGVGDTTLSLTHNVRRTCDDSEKPYLCVDFLSFEAGAVGFSDSLEEPVRNVDDAYVSFRAQSGPSLYRIEASIAVAHVDAPSNEGDVRHTFAAGIRSRLKDFHVGLDLIVSNRKHTTQQTSLNVKGKYQASRALGIYAGFEQGISDAFEGHFWQVGLEWFYGR